MASLNPITYLLHKTIAICIRTVLSFLTPGIIKRDAVFLPTNINKQRIHIPSRDPCRSINADLYTLSPPFTTSNSSLTKPPRPALIINFHGAGFVCPALGTDALFCSRLVHACGPNLAVLDADYRKGPEAPFPGPQEDIEDVLRWVSLNSERFDTSRVALSGSSSGATLALCAAASSHTVNVCAVIATYPMTDLALRSELRKAPKPVSPLPSWMLEVMIGCYVPDREQRTDPRASPAHAEISAYPDTVAFLLCDGDSVMPEAARLADRLEKEGKKVVRYMAGPGMPHGFDKGPKAGSEAARKRDEMYAFAAGTVREVFGL